MRGTIFSKGTGWIALGAGYKGRITRKNCTLDSVELRPWLRGGVAAGEKREAERRARAMGEAGDTNDTRRRTYPQKNRWAFQRVAREGEGIVGWRTAGVAARG